MMSAIFGSTHVFWLRIDRTRFLIYNFWYPLMDLFSRHLVGYKYWIVCWLWFGRNHGRLLINLIKSNVWLIIYQNNTSRGIHSEIPNAIINRNAQCNSAYWHRRKEHENKSPYTLLLHTPVHMYIKPERVKKSTRCV